MIELKNKLISGVRTKNGKVVKVYDPFEDSSNHDYLVNFIINRIINGDEDQCKEIAKYLTLPRLSKRSNSSKILDVTYKVMYNKAKFLALLSLKMDWEFTFSKHHANFIGYREWRNKYNSEDVNKLFSTKRILDYNESQFKSWFLSLNNKNQTRVKNLVQIMNEDENTYKWSKIKMYTDAI